MRNTASFDETRDWFLSLLLRRSCTRREAEGRLRRRGTDPAMSEALLAEAQEMGLLDDAAYARLFVEGHESWGRGRIAFELGQRGISDEDIQAALEEVDEVERATALAVPWHESGLETRKLVARLYRRGFDGRAIRSACRSLEDTGENEEDEAR